MRWAGDTLRQQLEYLLRGGLSAHAYVEEARHVLTTLTKLRALLTPVVERSNGKAGEPGAPEITPELPAPTPEIAPRRKRGRPHGSKNRPKRGRPKGSKSRPRPQMVEPTARAPR